MNISSLQTDYLNLDSSSDFGINSKTANTVQKKCTFGGGTNHSADFFQKDYTGKGKSSCGWSFGKNFEQNGHLKIILVVDLKIN